MAQFGIRWRAPAGALLVAVALAGCAGSDGGHPGATAGSGGAASSGARSTTNGTATGTATGGSGVDTGSAVARGSYHPPNAPDATVDIAVLSLKDDGNGKTVTLQVAFTPHGMPPTYANGTTSIWDMLNKDGIGPYLIDRTHLKRYDVISSGSGGKRLCSNLALTVARDGGTAVFSGTYALPQDGAASVEVWPSEAYLPLTNVPIQR